MSKKKKNRNKFDGRFAGVTHKQRESEAFKKLSIHAKWLYVEFRFKYDGQNDHKILLTKGEAKKIMAYKTFIKSRNKLIEVGLIDPVSRGGLEKRPAIYGLSDRWKKYGTKGFVEVDIKDILPKIYKAGFKKGNKLGRQSKR
ncbi:hypothetical protein ES707_04806 [subsurface metagenome]|jgi:hypothetical protein